MVAATACRSGRRVVHDDQAGDRGDQRELDAQRAPLPDTVMARLRGARDREDPERDEAPGGEAPPRAADRAAAGGGDDRVLILAAQDRDQHGGQHELAADEERHRDEVHGADGLPHGWEV